MSSRGRGRGGGISGQPPPSSGGHGDVGGRGVGHGGGREGGARGQPPPSSGGLGGVGGRRRGHGGFYVPPPQRTPASPTTRISAEMEQKLTPRASSSTQPVAPQPPATPVSSESLRPLLRPNIGTSGLKVLVKANHFLVSVADGDLCHYDVSILPEVLSKKVCRDIMNQLVKTLKASYSSMKELIYDGRKSCYTAGELPFKAKVFVVKLVDTDKDGSVRRKREFKVSMEFASKADLCHLQQFIHGRQLDSPKGTLHLLNVVLKQSPSNVYTVIGRSFFGRKLGDYRELGNGLEYWKGFYQSLRPTQMGLSLNINMSAKVFYKPICVSDYVRKYFNIDLTRPLSNKDRLKVEKALKGIRVEINHLGRIYRHKIVNLTTKPTQQLTFTLDETGETKSVVQHFRQKYKIELDYPHLPALQAGSSAKLVYLPMELCTIVDGQRYTKKLNERQVTSLLNATCQRPSDRERNISDMVERNNYNDNDIVKEFGINVNSQFTSIEARVLPTPMIKYHATGRLGSIQPFVGQWNMIDRKMINGGNIDYWACIDFSQSGTLDLDRFLNALIDMCLDKGMTFRRLPFVEVRSGRSDQIAESLTSLHAEACAKLSKENKKVKYLQLLIVILPDFSGSYGTIKRVCETELDILSQCCLPKNVSICNKQYLENVALKINVKVGGRNSVLEQALIGDFYGIEGPTIIFGADVSHPPPGEDSKPSIAAVVASMDWPQVTKYRGLVSAQPFREEIIQDLFSEKQDPTGVLVRGGMIRDHLLAFYTSNNATKPQQIIFYRDGVGEGQFSQVLLHEVDAIRKACASLDQSYMPRITFVVVQKRHHTRFFPANHGGSQTTAKSSNILPGTVIDTKICHPFNFDFYLCSHAGIKGTSRPAHYHVLYDENNFTPDQIQNLTNSLCYTYTSCTRSISIVPPAYYAHLAAYRAHHYMEDIERCDGELPLIKENVKKVMFYC